VQGVQLGYITKMTTLLLVYFQGGYKVKVLCSWALPHKVTCKLLLNFPLAIILLTMYMVSGSLSDFVDYHCFNTLQYNDTMVGVLSVVIGVFVLVSFDMSSCLQKSHI
jgi:hypothetical protein